MRRPQRDESLYHQLADLLRGRIQRGEYGPGSTLPTERELSRLHKVSVATVRRALAVLRGEGLIRTARGEPSTVRTAPHRAEIPAQFGSRLISRMPSTIERAEFGIEVGVPLIEIRHAGGRVDVLAADRVEIIWPDPTSA